MTPSEFDHAEKGDALYCKFLSGSSPCLWVDMCACSHTPALFYMACICLGFSSSKV